MSSSIGERGQMAVEVMTRYRLAVSPRPWRAAVELVRDLTGEGAVRARRLVEAGEIEIDVERWAAPWIAQVIADSGVEVEAEPALPRPALADEELPARIEASHERWAAEFRDMNSCVPMLAFDPRHPLGADQPLRRVYAEYAEREDLSVHPGELPGVRRCIVECGRLGNWERETEQRFDSQGELVDAIDRQLANWREEGLRIASDSVEVIAHFGVRNLALEAAINRAEDPSEPRRVYADWLSERGDPRGRVGQLEFALERELSATGRLALTTELDYLCRRHANHLAVALPGSNRWLRSSLILAEVWSAWLVFGRTLELPTVGCVRSLTLRGQIATPAGGLHSSRSYRRSR